MATKKPRVLVTMSEETKEWYEKQAGAFGCTISGLMSIALAEYKKNSELVKDIGNFQKTLEELQKTIVQTQLDENQKK